MTTRHLLFISTVYPTPWEPHKGPALANLVAALRQLGCRVTVVAPVPWTARRGTPTADRPPDTEFPTYWYLPGLMRQHYHRMMSWSLSGTLRRIARQSPPPGAVLAFWTDPEGTVAVRFGQAHGIRTGVIAAGSDIMLLAEDPARREVIAATLRSADHVFGVGSEIVRRAVGLGAAPEHVSNFIQGVDLQRFAPGDRADARQKLGLPAEGPLLLWVGNMVRVKAAERVILAARQLASRFPGLAVAMVGRGPEEGTLQALAAASGELSQRCFFPGPVASTALVPWYQAANLVVLPSRSEGVPNVLLEAMAIGTPFVASRVGSIADLLPFGPSRVVTEGEIGELVDAIGEVLLAADATPIAPKRHDLLDGAREILRHLHLDRS